MLNNQSQLFDLPDDISYLNCAYMSPQLKMVTAAGQQGLLGKQRPYEFSISSFFDPVHQLKEKFSNLINVSEPERIAIIPAVSYGIANVANNVKWEAGDEILVVDEQFPSNIYSWRQVCEEYDVQMVSVAASKNSPGRTVSWNEAILEKINANTKLVSICHVHWADGTVFDLQRIRQKTKEVGALLVIDGTQSVGALPFDQTKFQVDALICAGYKYLMGPYSLGLAYYGPYFDNGTPIEENWINRYNSQDFRALVNYQDKYQPLAGRYSVGEQSNFVLIPMLSKAIEQLLDWGVENIQSYTKSLGRDVLSQLRSEGFNIEEDAKRAGHLFGIQLSEQLDLGKFKNNLQEKKVFVSFRGNSIRVAPHVYNSGADFEQLYEVFKVSRK